MSSRDSSSSDCLITVDEALLLPSRRKIIAVSDPIQPTTFLTYQNSPFSVHKMAETLPTAASTKAKNDCDDEGIRRNKISINEFHKEHSHLQSEPLSAILSDDILQEDLHFMYVLAMHTVNNYFGKPGPKSCSSKDLYYYLNTAINLDLKTRVELIERSVSIRPPQFFVDVILVEATISDPPDVVNRKMSCQVSVGSDHQNAKFSKTIPAGSKWNDERYRFDVSDVREDSLNFDVLVHSPGGDETTRVARKTSCFQMGRVSRTPQFYGRASLEVADIYSEGMDRWIPLNSPNSLKGGTAKGSVHVVVIIGSTQNYGGVKALKRFVTLLKICVQGAMDKDKRSKTVSCWDDLLPRSAYTLIFLFSVLENIPQGDDLICWFLVINRMVIRSMDVSFQFMYNLLADCVKTLKTHSRPNRVMEPALYVLYTREAENLNVCCSTFLKNLHSNDIAGDRNKSLDFEFALKNVELTNNICEISNDPVLLLKYEAFTWFETMSDKISKVSIAEKSNELIKFLSEFKAFQNAADRAYRNYCANMAYTEEIFDHLENFVCGTLKCQIKDIATTLLYSNDREMSEKAIAVYIKAYELFLYIKGVIKPRKSQIQLENLREWFGKEVIHYIFKQRVQTACNRITKELSIENVSLFQIKRPEQFISSLNILERVADTHILQLWTLVSEPKSDEYAAIFVKALEDCCTAYANAVCGKLSSGGQAEKSAKVRRRKLFVQANELCLATKFLEKTLKETVGCRPSEATASKFAVLSDQLCADVSEKVAPSVTDKIKKTVQCNYSLKRQLALRTYRRLIRRVVWKDAFANMEAEVFVCFHRQFWRAIMQEVECLMEEGAGLPTELQGRSVDLTGVDEEGKLRSLLKVVRETEKFWKKHRGRLDGQSSAGIDELMEETRKKIEAHFVAPKAKLYEGESDGL